MRHGRKRACSSAPPHCASSCMATGAASADTGAGCGSASDAHGSSSVTSSHSGYGAASAHLAGARREVASATAAARRSRRRTRGRTRARLRRPPPKMQRRRRLRACRRVNERESEVPSDTTQRRTGGLVGVERVRARQLAAKGAHSAGLLQLVALHGQQTQSLTCVSARAHLEREPRSGARLRRHKDEQRTVKRGGRLVHRRVNLGGGAA